MTENYKSIVAATWVEFVAELKRTSTEGKQNPQRLLYQHNFFKAVMVEGKNAGFAEALDQITGGEVEVLKCLDILLESASMKSTEAKQNTSTETPSSTVNSVEKQLESGVEVALVKSKPSSRKRSKKQGEQL